MAFEAAGERWIGKIEAEGRGGLTAEARADHTTYYSGTFFVPAAARWKHLRDDLHNNVGDGLNKALAALEDHNPALEGVVQHIDFTRTVGQSRIPDRKLRNLIAHFSPDPSAAATCSTSTGPPCNSRSRWPTTSSCTNSPTSASPATPPPSGPPSRAPCPTTTSAAPASPPPAPPSCSAKDLGLAWSTAGGSHPAGADVCHVGTVQVGGQGQTVW